MRKASGVVLESDFDSRLTQAGQGRQQGHGRIRYRGRLRRQRTGGGEKHAVRDAARLSGENRESHGGKDIDVIALRDADGTALILDIRIRRTRGDQGAAVCPAKKIPRDGFGLRSGIGQRQDDGPRTFAGHLANDGFGERAGKRGEADENGRVNLMHDLGQANLIVSDTPRKICQALRGLRVDALPFREVIALRMENAIAVDEPEARTRFLLRQTVGNHGFAEKIGDANACGACTQHHDLLIAEWAAGNPDSGKNRSTGNRSGALNIVVKSQELIAVAVQDGPRMGLREIFPLQQRFG